MMNRACTENLRRRAVLCKSLMSVDGCETLRGCDGLRLWKRFIHFTRLCPAVQGLQSTALATSEPLKALVCITCVSPVANLIPALTALYTRFRLTKCHPASLINTEFKHLFKNAHKKP